MEFRCISKEFLYFKTVFETKMSFEIKTTIFKNYPIFEPNCKNSHVLKLEKMKYFIHKTFLFSDISYKVSISSTLTVRIFHKNVVSAAFF